MHEFANMCFLAPCCLALGQTCINLSKFVGDCPRDFPGMFGLKFCKHVLLCILMNFLHLAGPRCRYFYHIFRALASQHWCIACFSPCKLITRTSFFATHFLKFQETAGDIRKIFELRYVFAANFLKRVFAEVTTAALYIGS